MAARKKSTAAAARAAFKHWRDDALADMTGSDWPECAEQAA